jgi:hypothetical protein
MLRKITNKSGLVLMLLSMLALNAGFIPNAFAVGYLSKASVILTNDNAAGAGAVIIEFTTSATNTGTTLSLAFTGYTGTTNGFVAATQPVANSYNGSTCTSITGASAYLPGTPAATGNAATGVITFSGITAYTASTSYCAVLTSATAVTEPTTAGAQTATLTAGTDTADPVSLYTITNDTVIVNATVPPSFTFGLSGAGSDNLGALSTGSIVGTTGITATVSTNSKSGWFLFGSDNNVGLHSTAQNYTVASGNTVGSVAPGATTTLTAGHEGYVSAITTSGIVQGTGSAGTTSATTAFASTASGQGAGLNTSEEEMASSTGTASSASVPVKEYATIASTTPAALDYTDTVTLVAAGSF